MCFFYEESSAAAVCAELCVSLFCANLAAISEPAIIFFLNGSLLETVWILRSSYVPVSNLRAN